MAGRIRSAISSTLICGKIILSQRNLLPEFDNLAGLPRLPRDEGGPALAKPWQAAAFALAIRLSAQGHFLGKNGRLRWRTNCKRTQSVVNRMMARVTRTVG